MDFDREEGGFGSGSVSRILYRPGYSPSTVTYSDVPNVDWRGRFGVRIKGYHSRLRKGELLPLTYWLQASKEGNRSTQEWSYQKTNYPALGSSRYVWPIGPTVGTPSYGPTVQQVYDRIADYSAIRDGLVQAAAADIYSQGWDALTFLAELRAVIRMFRSLVQKCIDIANARPPGVPWNLWLEWRYGWRTLSRDIDDIINALIVLDTKRKRHKRSKSSEDTFTELSSSSGDAGDLTYVIYDQCDFTVGHRGSVIADIKPPPISFNPAITAWEIVRFSFVVDWILGVGRWLAALSFMTLQSKYYAAGGCLITCRSTRQVIYTGKAGWTVTSQPGPITCETSVLVRLPQSVPSIPLITVKLDNYKLVDLLALLVQAIKRK